MKSDNEKLAAVVEWTRDALLRAFPDSKVTIVVRQVVKREVDGDEVTEAGPAIFGSNDSFQVLQALFSDPRVHEAAQEAARRHYEEQGGVEAPSPEQAAHDAKGVDELNRLFGLGGVQPSNA